MTKVTPAGPDEVRGFVAAAGLPSDDLGGVPTEIRVARRDGRLVGTVGVELYGRHGLLRSLAVAETERGAGLGARLVREAEAAGRALGLRSMVLLTTTAASFFERQGYTRLDRSEAPNAVRQSSQFRGTCPGSATCLAKAL